MLVKHKPRKDIIDELKNNNTFDIYKDKITNLIMEIQKNYYKGHILIKCDNTWRNFVKNIKNIICNI
jgi:hypothetical protein